MELVPGANRVVRLISKLWVKSIKSSEISDAISHARYLQKSSHLRVQYAMAQFVLKIEKLSHVLGTTPIMEMARTYGLRP